MFKSPNIDVGAGARTPFSVPSPGADTRTEAEKIKSPHQARLLPCPSLLTPVHTGSDLRSPLVLPTGSSFVSTVSPFPSMGTGSVHRHHSLPQAQDLHSLKLQLIQQDCTSLYTAMRLYLHLLNGTSSSGAIPIPLGVVVQANNMNVPFPSCHITDNFSWTASFQCCCGWGKEERGRCDNSDRHRISDPWRSAGVGVGGLVGFCDVPRDTMLQGILQVGSASAQTVREIPLAPMGILRRRPKEATTPLHHNCPGLRTAMADLLVSHRSHNQ